MCLAFSVISKTSAAIYYREAEIFKQGAAVHKHGAEIFKSGAVNFQIGAESRSGWSPNPLIAYLVFGLNATFCESTPLIIS